MESVSALMDGELNVDDAVREIARLKTDAALREHWDTYHLIGDAMRGSAASRKGFGARLSERLALEPTVLAPPASKPVPAPAFARKLQTYALSAAASVAAVAAVGWVAMSTIKSEVPGPLAQGITPPAQLAPAPAPAAQPPALAAPAPAEAVAEAPAERMQEYLLAHQGISPTTAIQGVTPYIRTVSDSND